MNDIVKTDIHLPDTLEDLAQFVLVGKAKLNAYMIKLQSVKRLSVAQEIRDQTLQEAQEVSTALIAAEQRIGEILLSIPKQSGGVNQYNKEEKSTRVEKSKSQVTEEMGYTRHEVSDYQQMAKNPEVVQRVIKDALENGDVVTKTQVMREIRALKEELRREKEKSPEVKTVVREVVPSDYREAKNKAKAYDAETRRLNKRLEDAYKERNYLQDRVAELEGATKEGLDTSNLSENVFYFCTICNNFIGNVGGLVWLTDRIADMPEKQRDMFLKASNSFRDWSLAFTQNLERRVNEYEQTAEFDSRVPVLTDKESRRQD